MAHYAYLDESNIVTAVVPGKDEGDSGVDWEDYYGAKRTSYNTHGGVHVHGGVPFRKNYAGVGYTYDEQRDAFIPPSPYRSWVLNEDSCLWQPPVPQPTEPGFWMWDETAQEWIDLTPVAE